jgi:succinate dehydrogenase flavin-adding protein (antitoxin of CptAB toxin-antitoxin module)
MVNLDIPMYDPTVDYQYLYHKLFQENESMLQQYDRLLELRDRDLKTYMALKRGQYKEYVHNKLSNPFNSLVSDNIVNQVRQNLIS